MNPIKVLMEVFHDFGNNKITTARKPVETNDLNLLGSQALSGTKQNPGVERMFGRIINQDTSTSDSNLSLPLPKKLMSNKFCTAPQYPAMENESNTNYPTHPVYALHSTVCLPSLLSDQDPEPERQEDDLGDISSRNSNSDARGPREFVKDGQEFESPLEDINEEDINEEENNDNDDDDNDDDDDDKLQLLNNESFEDIDEPDTNVPVFATHYIGEIMAYLRVREEKDQIPEGYLKIQTDIRPHHRDILVEWMLEVYCQLKLLSETVFLAVNIVDRILAKRPVSRKKVQLLAVGAILIAAKYEELWAPLIKDLCYACNYGFTREEILKMEKLLLSNIDFDLGVASPLFFLRRFSKAGRADPTTHTLGKFLTEISLTSFELVSHKPSMVAAAAVYLARRMRQISPLWNSNLRHYTRYSEEEVVSVARNLNSLLKREVGKQNAVVRKYTTDRLLSVARIPMVEF